MPTNKSNTCFQQFAYGLIIACQNNRRGVIARRMIWEKLIEGTKYENELKNKNDKHIINVMKSIGLWINCNS